MEKMETDPLGMSTDVLLGLSPESLGVELSNIKHLEDEASVSSDPTDKPSHEHSSLTVQSSTTLVQTSTPRVQPSKEPVKNLTSNLIHFDTPPHEPSELKEDIAKPTPIISLCEINEECSVRMIDVESEPTDANIEALEPYPDAEHETEPREEEKETNPSLSLNKTLADYRLQFPQAEGGLVSVPEHAPLTQVEPAIQVQTHIPESKESDATSETQSESNSTAVSSRTGGYYPQFTKTEPLTAKQQVALWLTRTSTQDLSAEFSVSSLRSLVTPSSINKFKKNKNVAKNPEITRNFSTKSLMEKFTPSKDQSYVYSPIRKCETVLALSEGRDRDARGFESFTSASSHGCHGLPTAKRRCGGRSSNSSLLKRFSKTGSQVFSAQLKHGRTAPGELGGTETPTSGVQPLRPVNRLRSSSSLLQCSRCTSVLSMNNSRATSQMSLLLDRKNSRIPAVEDVLCKICLVDYPPSAMSKLEDCTCTFCKECMNQYITFEVMEGAYDISCPDQDCPNQGVLTQHEMERMSSRELLDKHRTFRLNTEVSLDAARTFCPSAGCDTICHICVGTKSQGVPVSCPTCVLEFCSQCSSTWHPGLSCSENGALLVARGGGGGPDDWECDGSIKKCPMCHVPIERDAGCAQMMCKRCKHVFCWYCLTSLDDDFLLRHYDSGECKGMLGHSRASVIWHRAQVIGIFAGFGILLLVASPLLLVAAPCVLCCKCRSCTKPLDVGSDRSESSIAKLAKSPS